MSRYADPVDRSKKWTQKALEAIGAESKGETLREAGGLVGEVRVSNAGDVSVNFRYAFKRAGKKAWHYCGTWPSTSLADIRGERDRARTQAAEGVDPVEQRKAERIEAQAKVRAVIAEAARLEEENLPVHKMFEAWLADGVARADGNAELRRSFQKDVLPLLGETPVRQVSEHDLRTVLRTMVKRGVHRMAVRTYSDLVQMFAWAEKRKPWRGLMVDGNPAELVEIEKILPPGNSAMTPRERTLSPDELRELQRIHEEMESAYASAPAGSKYEADRPLKKETQLALWLCLGTACRIGELLMARWEHVDLQAGEWFVPAANTKTGVDWRVFLSAYSRRQFENLRALTGDSPFCFPARVAKGETANMHVCVKSVSKQVGDRQMRFKNRAGPMKNRRHDNSLVLGNGVKGEWTPHDLRRTAATMMQALGVLPDIIDRCQNHVLAGGRVRRHYLHHDYANEKRAAWDALGDRLESIFSKQPLGPNDLAGSVPS
ncbi:site-specific integrase [Pelomonas sp. KK5]|uniref:tyrosine-type recombinase/integrase n=1 Tax=Pelomonas sp. KK5 TaxID=1855730 RepID=UPI00097C638B|nr:site-specific integrase [Pelomonas sp. KK5]